MDDVSVENGGMKFVVGKNGRNLEKTYPHTVCSTTQPTWSDRDANSGRHLQSSTQSRTELQKWWLATVAAPGDEKA